MRSLLPGLALALVASVALNTSYVLQHRGAAGSPDISPRAPLATLRSLLRSRWWAAGAVVGIGGWALHITALARAPLSLVQAFVAGGLALAVPLAARIAGERIGGGEAAAVAILVLALVLLAVGLHPGPRHPHFAGSALGLWLAGLAVLAGGIAAGVTGPRRAAALGLAGGLLYGAADMAVKALTGAAASGGLGGVIASPWLAAAAVTTMGAFFCFQRGLQRGAAVPVIALMTAGTNASSIAGGFLVFGDPFGRGALFVTAHAAGLALVGVGAWRLAPAQARLTQLVGDAPGEAGPPASSRPPAAPVGRDPGRRAASVLRAFAGLLVALLAIVAGVGLLYVERTWHVLGAGPRIGGALPLQQLNGDASQPLLRLLVVWPAAGAVAAWALVRLGRLPARVALVIPPLAGLALLLLAGAESDAVVVDGVLSHHLSAQPHRPAIWAAALLLAVGAALVAAAPRPGLLPRPRTVVSASLAALLVAGGIAGSAAYGRNYWLYRGFPPPTDPPGVAHGTFVTRSFYSPALHEHRRYLVYEPAGYAAQAAAGRRFPVLYLLHAAPGRPDTTFKSGAIGVRYDVGLAHRRLRHLLIVIPYGKSGHFHSDTEWANAKAGRYMGFVLDTVRDVDHRFATIRSRRARAIAGYSEGGYGAMNVALHHLGTFGVAEAWSGYFVQTPTAAFTGASGSQLAANSPIAYVPGLRPVLRRRLFTAYLYVGNHDDVTIASMRRFAARLSAAGGHVESAVFPGRHTWRLWRAEMPRALAFASRHLRGY